MAGGPVKTTWIIYLFGRRRCTRMWNQVSEFVTGPNGCAHGLLAMAPEDVTPETACRFLTPYLAPAVAEPQPEQHQPAAQEPPITEEVENKPPGDDTTPTRNSTTGRLAATRTPTLSKTTSMTASRRRRTVTRPPYDVSCVNTLCLYYTPCRLRMCVRPRRLYYDDGPALYARGPTAWFISNVIAVFKSRSAMSSIVGFGV